MAQDHLIEKQITTIKGRMGIIGESTELGLPLDIHKITPTPGIDHTNPNTLGPLLRCLLENL